MMTWDSGGGTHIFMEFLVFPCFCDPIAEKLLVLRIFLVTKRTGKQNVEKSLGPTVKREDLYVSSQI